MTKKLHIKTYGCQMNVYDSNRMADVLKPHGYGLVDDPDAADLVILNTCHIREKAAEKMYSDIGRLRLLKDRKSGHGDSMFIAVAGCVAQAEGAEIMRRAPVVDMVLGPQTYHRLPEMLEKAEEAVSTGRKPRIMDTDFPAETKFDGLPVATEAKAANAFLTVQEGCDKFCTFCVVPYTRGAEYSRPVADIMREAEALVAGGVLEIMLLGQNVNAFHGTDNKGREVTLAGLIEKLAGISGLERIRYTTSHPRDMRDDLLAVHRDIPACMPYLHLPVQSGSDAILEAMNRQHKAADYIRIIERLRSYRPDVALSGDFIVGFPGETDQDFEATMALVRDVNYAQAYSFKYSPRPGTPASVNTDQVPEEVKSERLQALQALLNEQQMTFNQAFVGKTMDVLLERDGKEDNQLVGRSPYLQAVHVSLNDMHSALDGASECSYTDFKGRIVPVTIAEAGPNSLKGVVAQPSVAAQ